MMVNYIEINNLISGSDSIQDSSGYSEWRKPSEKQDFANDIENCAAYITFISQFSICITALNCHLSHAVIHNDDMYRVETDNGDLLVSSEHNVYVGEEFPLRNSDSSSVLNTLITLVTEGSLKCESFDQTGQFNLSANAKYCLSSGSEISEIALFNCCGETLTFKLTNLDNISFILSNLSSETLSNSQSSCECSSNSFSIILWEYKSKEYSCANLLVNESFFNNQEIDAPPRLKRRGLIGARFLDARSVPHTKVCGFQTLRHENAMLASITNLIYLPFDSFTNLSLTNLANLIQSSSVNALSLVNSSSSLNSIALCDLLSNSCFTNSDQTTQTNLDNLIFNSSFIANVTDAIYSSPLAFNSSTFSSSSSFLMITLRDTSATFTSGNSFLNLINNSLGICIVILNDFVILTPRSIYVYTSNYASIYKSFGRKDLSNFNLMSKCLPKTTFFRMWSTLRAQEICSQRQISAQKIPFLRNFLASKNRAPFQTTTFKSWWCIDFLMKVSWLYLQVKNESMASQSLVINLCEFEESLREFYNLLLSGESFESSLLNLPFFAFLPSSIDQLIKSCSSLDLNLLSNICFNTSLLIKVTSNLDKSILDSSACFFNSSLIYVGISSSEKGGDE